MLEVIGAARGFKAVHDWTEVWKTSEERVQVRKEFDEMVASLSQIEDDGQSAAGYELFAMPFSTQLWECFKRVWLQYWRTPSYIYAKLSLVIICSLFIGFTFWKAKNTLQGLQNQLVCNGHSHIRCLFTDFFASRSSPSSCSLFSSAISVNK